MRRFRVRVSAVVASALTALLPIGFVATVASPASAAAGDASGVVVFTCQMAQFPTYPWNPTVTVSAIRPVGSTTVTVTAHTTDMAGVAPVALNYDVTDQMVLAIDGSPVTLNGSGHVNAAANSPFPLPDTTGSFTSSAPSVTVKVTSYGFALAGMSGTCTPTSGATLGSMTIAVGTPPAPTPTPTTVVSATATPSGGASTATDSSAASGTPAHGKTTFACVLNPLNSKFSYPATISVAAYRVKPTDDLTLSATMQALPGIAPVVIDGTMDVTLGLLVDGKAVTLKGSTHAMADPKQPVAVPTLTGTAPVSGDSLKVSAKSFTFNFPDLNIDAGCTSAPAALGLMRVGTKSAAAAATDAAAAATSLPKTGASNVGLMLAWALGLISMGGAGLVLARRVR